MEKIAEMNFEEAFKALEEIVKKMEAGQISLEESVAAYEKGAALKKRCMDLLAAAEVRIEKIKPDGSVEKFTER
ncbi:MAG: exodeoxyribonuclease VII small subunit [Rickettsiales bacterium]|jgi:exodeoxyribonuclease VII small subunit|nr:exodeoxyribonuclease VII small subunit [Rickettsiales bacterium]